MLYGSPPLRQNPESAKLGAKSSGHRETLATVMRIGQSPKTNFTSTLVLHPSVRIQRARNREQSHQEALIRRGEE